MGHLSTLDISPDSKIRARARKTINEPSQLNRENALEMAKFPGDWRSKIDIS